MNFDATATQRNGTFDAPAARGSERTIDGMTLVVRPGEDRRIAPVQTEPLGRIGTTPAVQPAAAAGVALSPREREVLTLLARGLTCKEAADALGLAAKTVDNHTQRLMRKLDVHTRAQVVLYAVRHGYVQP